MRLQEEDVGVGHAEFVPQTCWKIEEWVEINVTKVNLEEGARGWSNGLVHCSDVRRECQKSETIRSISKVKVEVSRYNK